MTDIADSMPLLDTSNCNNCVQLFGHWQQELLKQWSKHLSVAVSTTVTHRYTTCLTVSFRSYSQPRMQLHVSTPAPDDVTTSRMRWSSCTWLPVWRRVEYKVICLVHRSLSGQTPAYLTDDVNLVADSGRRLLRSAVDRTCVVPCTHNTYGDKTFTAVGPRVWNSLPSYFWQDISYGLCKQKMKTFLFWH